MYVLSSSMLCVLKHYLFWRQGDRIIEFLLHVLDGDDSDKVQALICMGLAKLMLAGMASEDRVSWVWCHGRFTVNENSVVTGTHQPHSLLFVSRHG
jgi:hypothetical protein